MQWTDLQSSPASRKMATIAGVDGGGASLIQGSLIRLHKADVRWRNIGVHAINWIIVVILRSTCGLPP